MAIETLKNGNKLLFCGDDGSAADAQHIVAELSGRYKKERKGLAGIAINRVFDRQVEALANKGDLLIGISTSGNSQNIINAFKVAKEIGCKTIGLSGRDGGKFHDVCDLNIIVPSDNTPRIQEMHILIGHTIYQLIDNKI